MFKKTSLGYEYKSDKILVFFGDRNGNIEKLKHEYPEIKFRFIQQTHSDILLSSKENSDSIIGDAHWTTEKNIALVIKTADCMPIMAYDENQQIALAIHAGWKGVENKITLKSLRSLNIKFCSIFIGPHITYKSFEVDRDVKDALAQSSFNLNEDEFSTQTGEKYFVDLEKIVRSQILQSTERLNIETVPIDTKTTWDFHSYRRGKQSSERNLSFIALL